MTTVVADPKPKLIKAVKFALSAEIKTAFVSISRFLPADLVITKLRATLPDVRLKAYRDVFTSLEDWLTHRRQVIKGMDALIVAIGTQRNASNGVVREVQLARKCNKPIFLFNIQTGLFEPFTGYRLTAFFPPAEGEAK